MLLVPSDEGILGQRSTLFHFKNKMTPKEAEAKYGKRNLELMQRHLEGITLSIDPKTKEINIPERDLERAFDMIIKGKSNIMWD